MPCLLTNIAPLLTEKVIFLLHGAFSKWVHYFVQRKGCFNPLSITLLGKTAHTYTAPTGQLVYVSTEAFVEVCKAVGLLGTDMHTANVTWGERAGLVI